MILNETVAKIADAIREKTGKSELIKPVDFAEEIKGISVGGGESVSNVEYFDFSGGLNESWATYLIMSFIEVKGHPTLISGQSANLIAPANVYKTLVGELLSVRQASIDFSMPIIISAGGHTQTATVADFLIQQGATQEKLDALPRITKEQFYSLV